MGSARLGDLIGQLENSVPTVLAQLMTDTTVPMDQRLLVWLRAPNQFKVQVYDSIYEILRRQLEAHPLGQRLPMDKAFPPPPGLDEYRQRKAKEEAEKKEPAENIPRSDVERR